MALSNIFRSIWDDPWEGMVMPSNLYNQNFGTVVPDDLLLFLPRHGGHRYLRNAKSKEEGGLSEVVNNEKEFRINLDVRHFKPEELKLTTKDNRIIINARHEEQPDEHGYIMREFTRQYILPKDVDPKTVTSSLTQDGILRLSAPKLALEAPKEQTIPITFEGSGDSK